MPLPPHVLDQAVDALAVVLAALTEWRAHELSAYKRAWIEDGRAAVISRDELKVRAALAECALILNELADSKDCEKTNEVIRACHAALMAIQRAHTISTPGRLYA